MGLRTQRLSCLQASCFPFDLEFLGPREANDENQVGSNCVPIPGLLRPSPGSSQTPAPLGLISAAISTSIRHGLLAAMPLRMASPRSPARSTRTPSTPQERAIAAKSGL